MLSGELWCGRTTIRVQYWSSSDHLFAYARNREAQHLPAWRAFNQAVGTNGDVGVWHETYVVSTGTYENICVSMPPFGLGKVGTPRHRLGSSPADRSAGSRCTAVSRSS
jgi:hypothetical protein